MEWWIWVIIIVAIVAAILALVLAVQARRRSGGVIIADPTPRHRARRRFR